MGRYKLFNDILRASHAIRMRDDVILPVQIGPHQVSYVAVATLIVICFAFGEDMSFPTIGPNYNGPLQALQ